MKLQTTATLALALVYLYRSVWQVWPHLFQTGGDFEGYFRAAGEMLAGRSPFLDRFDYPPLVAFLALPLHPLGLELARVAWFLLSHACLLGAAYFLFRALSSDRIAFWVVASLWALSGALPENLAIGQVQPLLLFLICLAWASDGDRSPESPRAARALGLAAGLKIWPGLLLAAFLGPEKRRDFVAGLAATGLAIALPLALIAALFPPPHLPTRSDFWMGTPAALNWSLPALVLRATDPDARADSIPPPSWREGNSSETFTLSPERRTLSVAVSLGTLALGLLVLAWRRPERLSLLAALTVLTTLASPLSWYHYQLFQLPALALLAVRTLRRHTLGAALPRLAGLALLGFGLTRVEARDLLLGTGTAGEVQRTGAVIVALQVVLFVLLLRRNGSAPGAREAGVLP